MGSKSDYPIMKEATEILDEFGISYETEIVSAHRTPEKMMDYSKNAHKRGIKVIIAVQGVQHISQAWLHQIHPFLLLVYRCLLYTSDAADES